MAKIIDRDESSKNKQSQKRYAKKQVKDKKRIKEPTHAVETDRYPDKKNDKAPGRDADFLFVRRQKKKPTLSEDDFWGIKKSKKEYYQVDLDKMWDDSSVSAVYFRRNCVVEMDICVTRSYVPERIPETAGFFLGQYLERINKEEKRIYEVVCDTFISARHLQANQSEIKFKSSTFSDLAINIDQHPNLGVIGWFHTHPALGVFLSTLDESIHYNFFREEWQIAVVVDPIIDRLGIFTWNIKKELNNIRKAKKKFADWHELSQWLKKRE